MDVRLRILGICAALAVSAFILLFPEDTSPPLPDPSSVMDYVLIIQTVEIIASKMVGSGGANWCRSLYYEVLCMKKTKTGVAIICNLRP